MANDPIGDADTLVFFPFSETSGATTTDVAGGRTGVLKGAASLAIAGKTGSGLSLPGAGSFVEVAHEPDFTLAAGTLAFWARPDAVGTLQGLVGKDADGFGTGGHLSVLLRADGRVSFLLQSGAKTFQAISDRALEADDWAHVAVSWGADGMRLYLDGVLAGSSAYVGGLQGNAEPWVIGANAGKSAALSSTGVRDYFRGALDEFALLDRQLDADGVAALMQGEDAPKTLSFAGQTDRAKVVDLAQGLWVDAARVMPLGDSITAGVTNLIGAAQYEGYRRELWSLLTEDGLWIDYVGGAKNGSAALPDPDHQGVPGIRASISVTGKVDVRDTAASDAAAHRPDVVLLMLGSNDVMNEKHAASTLPGDLLAIIKDIAAVQPGVTILLAPLPPIDPAAPGYKSTLRADADLIRDAVNAKLPGVAAQAQALGVDARFVPMPGLSKGDLYDGVHPTAAGYAKIAAAWFGALSEGLALATGDFGGPRAATAGVRDLEGSELGDLLRGDADPNRIDGRGGNDRIAGGLGADALTGGAGRDVFVYHSAGEGGDTLADFTPGADRLEFSALGFGGGLTAGGPAILRSAVAPAAQGGAGQFLYADLEGRLFWDGDGNDAAQPVLIATLTGAPALIQEDFLIL